MYTAYYTAPEILEGKYDRAADLWSVGAILFCLLFGYPCFYVSEEDIPPGQTEEEAIYELIKGGFKPQVLPDWGPWFPEDMPVSDEARDFISKLLTTDVKVMLFVFYCKNTKKDKILILI